MARHHPFIWDSIAISHVGKVRKLNEDACLERPDEGLWIVADGMGGHSSGDLASQMVVNTFSELPLPDSLVESVNLLEEGLLEINRTLRDEADRRGGNTTIGCTVVILLAYERQMILLWAGDSRAYCFRTGQLTRITQDHTQVEELVEQGLLLREDAENHPASNVVTRAVGAMDELFIDFNNHPIEPGDTYLLCSDGLNKELQEDEIAAFLEKAGSVEQAGRMLIEETLKRGSRDNVTVVIARAVQAIDD
jgi:serine/threonine protein phosphatase PrpC